MQSEILDNQEEQGFSEELHGDGDQEVTASGYGASKDVESACSRDGSCGKIEIEEADGSSSGQKKHDLAVFVDGSILALNWEKRSALRLPRPGQKEHGQENGTINKKKHG